MKAILLVLSLLPILAYANSTPLVADISDGGGLEGRTDVALWIQYFGRGDGDFFLNLFFYVNLIWYTSYCGFIASITFGKNELEDVDGYTKYRNLCVEGAYYELQNATNRSKPKEE